MPKFTQVAAIPVRRDSTGLQVMLVTSRETRRWVIPKGWPWADRQPHESAEAEAWEEAGIKGAVQQNPLGHFHYDKRRKSEVLSVKVTAFLLEVHEEAASWPEESERMRAWFTLEAAADAVIEEELKQLLRSISL